MLLDIVLTFHCLNELFKWSQKFCKFSAFSLEFQRFFSITRIFFSHKIPKLLPTCFHKNRTRKDLVLIDQNGCENSTFIFHLFGKDVVSCFIKIWQFSIKFVSISFRPVFTLKMDIPEKTRALFASACNTQCRGNHIWSSIWNIIHGTFPTFFTFSI